MAPTIQLSDATRARIQRLKSSPRETYDEIIRKLLALIPDGDEEGRYTGAFRIGLLDARLDIKEGRLTDYAEVKKRLGL